MNASGVAVVLHRPSASAFPIPDAAFAQHTIALGKTRAGKSSKLRLIVERLLDAGKPLALIDPKGDWWGLKSSADGKSPGYPVVIFGGEHADAPINEHSGAAIAELICGGNRPCIIDLGGWMIAPRTRFFIDFAAALFRLTKGERWLAIDECHNFAPKGKLFEPQAAMMLHWANRLASEGAGKGLALLSASQRPQKVHNDYLTSHETLIACRAIHKADRDAFKDWIDGCADPAIGKEVLNGLANIERRQAYVWSPEIKFGPLLIDWPMFKTYDSFKPQGGGAPAALKGWASVDLEDVKAKLATAVEEAKANDPRALRDEIARLKAAAAKPADSAGDAVLQAEIHRLGAQIAADRQAGKAREKALREHGESNGRVFLLRGIEAGMNAAMNAIKTQLPALHAIASEEVKRWDALGAFQIILQPDDEKAIKAARASGQLSEQARGVGFAQASQHAQKIGAKTVVIDTLSARAAAERLGPERRILAALAQAYPAGMTEAQWAIAAGMKRSGGTWGTYKSRLRVASLIEQDGASWRATQAGLAALGDAPPHLPPPGRELVEFWAARIQAAGPMLRVLAARFPERLSRHDLAAALDMTPSGGTFGTYLSRLRTAGLLDEDRHGGVRAAPELMGQRP